MAYHSKTYSLSDEVIERLEALKEKYGSYNKGLLVALSESLPSPIATMEKRDGTEEKPAIVNIMPQKPLAQGRSDRKPILRPSEKKK